MNFKIINHYKIHAFESKELFLETIVESKKILIAMNAEKIMNNNFRLRKIINSNIAYTDGIGAVMALRSRGLKAIKIPGSEFWLDIVKYFQETKSFYLIGTTNEVIESTVARLKKEYPKVNIVGYRNGFLEENDKFKLLNDIKNSKPDIVFVAQGSPKQEFLMAELMAQHKALYMGLGGSFDIYGGDKKRAPRFFLNLELEWLYRLLKEPTRFKRQLALIKFIGFLVKKEAYEKVKGSF